MHRLQTGGWRPLTRRNLFLVKIAVSAELARTVHQHQLAHQMRRHLVDFMWDHEMFQARVALEYEAEGEHTLAKIYNWMYVETLYEDERKRLK